MKKKMGAPVELSTANNIVAETRRRLGISQAKLASMLKLTGGAVSQFETGKRRISGPVEELCRLLQTSERVVGK